MYSEKKNQADGLLYGIQIKLLSSIYPATISLFSLYVLKFWLIPDIYGVKTEKIRVVEKLGKYLFFE